MLELEFGKVPNDETHRIFMMGNFKDMKAGPDQKWMLDWMGRTQPDVRSKKKKVDVMRQSSILKYIVRSGAQHGKDSDEIAGR